MKIIMKARSYFKAEQWKNSLLKDDDVQLTIQAILKIQNELY